MKIAVLTLSVDERGAFDDRPLREFCEQHEVLSSAEHRYEFRGEPRLAFVLTYRSAKPVRAERSAPEARGGDVEALLVDLSQAERMLFERVRAWRNAKMKALGRPPFVILTNKQLVEVVQRRPDTLAALREIDGIGDGKCEQFGDELLEVLRARVEADGAEAGG